MTSRRVSLADYVFSELEKEILTERYKPGELLTELAVCERLEVSRTPVREAFRRLQQEGYLSETGRGNVVVGTTPDDMRDIYEIRLRTEGLATRWAAKRVTAAGLKALHDAVELQAFYTAKGDADHLQEQDADFHRLIFSHCGSPILGDMLSALHRRVQRYRRDSVQSRTRAGQMVKEHRAIYEALAKGDGDAAERLAIAHIEKARGHIAGEEKTWG